MNVAPQKKVTFDTNVMVHKLMTISKKNIPFRRGRPRSASMSGEGCSKWFTQSPVSNNNNESVSSLNTLLKESSYSSIISPVAIDSFEGETENESPVHDSQAEKEVSFDVPMLVECPEEIDLINLNASSEAENVEPFMEKIDDHPEEYSSATGDVFDVQKATLIDIDSIIENEDTHVVQRDTLVGNWVDDLLGFNYSNEANMAPPIEPLGPAGLFEQNARQTVKRAIPDLLPLRKETGPSKY